MKIKVGSKNPVKVGAVEELAPAYPMLVGAEVIGIDVPVEVFGHPKTLEETISGAIERAKTCFTECDYSFGIESGLMAVPHSKSGYMEITACAIYDGKNFHLGLSSAFEWPKKVADLIINKGLDGSQAVKLAGLTTHEKIGKAEGVISILTKGRLNRKEYTKQAVVMALTHLENPELF